MLRAVEHQGVLFFAREKPKAGVASVLFVRFNNFMMVDSIPPRCVVACTTHGTVRASIAYERGAYPENELLESGLTVSVAPDYVTPSSSLSASAAGRGAVSKEAAPAYFRTVRRERRFS
jgi:hypothetical protein